jgi:hypothetical protein
MAEMIYRRKRAHFADPESSLLFAGGDWMRHE